MRTLSDFLIVLQLRTKLQVPFILKLGGFYVCNVNGRLLLLLEKFHPEICSNLPILCCRQTQNISMLWTDVYISTWTTPLFHKVDDLGKTITFLWRVSLLHTLLYVTASTKTLRTLLWRHVHKRVNNSRAKCDVTSLRITAFCLAMEHAIGLTTGS